MPTVEKLKRSLFWLVARTCFALYGRFPLFGRLRASIGIIQQDDKFLLIQRNDGRGVSLPGGIARFREAVEDTLQREVLEETGLRVTSQQFLFRYNSSTDVPCDISVFEVQATGELKNSWEGAPLWMTLAEIEPRMLPSQLPALELLRKRSSGSEEST